MSRSINEYGISQRKVTKLYHDVAEEIMLTRIEIAKDKSKKWDWSDVDDILSKLHITCPEVAIKVFKKYNK